MFFKNILPFALMLFLSITSQAEEDMCYKPEDCDPLDTFATNELNGQKYLLYEVAHEEGFNLRRDVYIRMADLVLRLGTNWTLVLPPFGPLVHWKSKNKRSFKIPWSTFFEVEQLQEIVPVVEFDTFLQHVAHELDEVLVLTHFPDMFGSFRSIRGDEQSEDIELLNERHELYDCNHIDFYTVNDRVEGRFFGYGNNVWAKKQRCMKLEGSVSTLASIIPSLNVNTLFLQNAEVATHAVYGDERFWLIRRSMRFAPKLVEIAAQYRKREFDCEDTTDRTFIGDDWRLERLNKQRMPGDALGGPYAAVHMRLGIDFSRHSQNKTTIKNMIKQAIGAMKTSNVSNLFVASDCSSQQWSEIQKNFYQLTDTFELYRFESNILLDGEKAIVDQIICSHARLFIGTLDSTFTLRIQEEREIYGFARNKTFVVFCEEEADLPCEQKSQWKIVYEKQIN